MLVFVLNLFIFIFIWLFYLSNYIYSNHYIYNIFDNTFQYINIFNEFELRCFNGFFFKENKGGFDGSSVNSEGSSGKGIEKGNIKESFWDSHGNKIIIGIIVIFVGFVGWDYLSEFRAESVQQVIKEVAELSSEMVKEATSLTVTEASTSGTASAAVTTTIAATTIAAAASEIIVTTTEATTIVAAASELAQQLSQEVSTTTSEIDSISETAAQTAQQNEIQEESPKVEQQNKNEEKSSKAEQQNKNEEESSKTEQQDKNEEESLEAELQATKEILEEATIMIDRLVSELNSTVSKLKEVLLKRASNPKNKLLQKQMQDLIENLEQQRIALKNLIENLFILLEASGDQKIISQYQIKMRYWRLQDERYRTLIKILYQGINHSNFQNRLSLTKQLLEDVDYLFMLVEVKGFPNAFDPINLLCKFLEPYIFGGIRNAEYFTGQIIPLVSNALGSLNSKIESGRLIIITGNISDNNNNSKNIIRSEKGIQELFEMVIKRYSYVEKKK